MTFEQAFRMGARLQGVTRLGFEPRDVAAVAEDVVQRFRDVPHDKIHQLVIDGVRSMPTERWYDISEQWELKDWRSQLFGRVRLYIESSIELPPRFRIIEGGAR